MSVVGVLVFVATYLGLVRTYLGQYLENAALLGAKQATTEAVDGALENLNVISIASLVIMMIGFAIARRLPLWATIALAIAFELLTLAVIRDNLTLNVLMLVWPIDAIRHWQAG